MERGWRDDPKLKKELRSLWRTLPVCLLIFAGIGALAMPDNPVAGAVTAALLFTALSIAIVALALVAMYVFGK